MIVVWNARGAAGKDFGSTVKEFKRKFRPSLVVLVETRCSGERAQQAIKRMGFTHQLIVEAQGMSGGIWLLWNEAHLKITALKTHKQFIHCTIEGMGKCVWSFSEVYASPREMERKDLWTELELISRSTRGPWLVAGDLNDIISKDEQRGGTEPVERKCKRFKDYIESCNLIDLGSEGPRFTWRGPMVNHGTRLFKRLDRALCNRDWKLQFGDAKVTVGPRILSDHHPLLIQLEARRDSIGERPFRFEAAWLTNAEFKDTVKSKWRLEDKAWVALRALEADLKVWNVDTFGHIRQRKHEVLRRIGGIQRKLQEQPNSFLEDLEKRLQQDLRDILLQEEILWFQKSRTKWLNDGDRNTSFYHLKTRIKRSRNRIDMLKNEDNEWVEGKAQCGELVNRFFQTLFQEEDFSRPWWTTTHTWPSLDQDLWDRIDAPLSNEEIKQAMFSIGSLKAPGEDGFQALFFQKCWDIVGISTCDAVRDIWLHPELTSEINQTLVTLIPKVERPERVQQFRPISLCNVIYKCVSKIVVARLKSTMASLISPHQVSFVPGRNIHDNIVIVNEMIHSMRRKKGRKGYMAIKVDLEKAYDRMSWNYLEKVLEELKCPQAMRTRILACVNTVSTKITWHGEKMEEFKPSRGLRQGDPVSPYLFVLGMEKLTHLILDRVRDKKWKGMRAGGRGPIITHMMFADDLVLFAEADQTNIETVLKCLQDFGAMSGHRVSSEKTVVYFSPNVDSRTRRSICCDSGFKEVPDLGRYLGAEIRFPKRRRDRYKNIVERVARRLKGWKASSLSLAGRITLVNSVTNTIPLYHMQHDILPSGVLLDIERLQRNFIWGEEEGKKAWHQLAWDRMCMPKHLGGVGIKSLKHMNEAFVLKSLWRLHTNPSDLWVQVLLGKYGRSWREGEQLSAKPTDSRLWKELVRNWATFEQNIERAGASTAEDIIIWKATGHGEFTTKSAYSGIHDSSPVTSTGPWKFVWKLRVPERIRVFIWRCLHKKLPTNALTGQWDGGSGCCSVCIDQREDILHALRDCPEASLVWRELVPVRRREAFFGSDWRNWFEDNLMAKPRLLASPYWPEIFAVSCSLIWQWRNKRQAIPHFSRPQNGASIIRQNLGTYLLGWDMQRGGVARELFIPVSWKAPSDGWIKLNTDGALNAVGAGGCGGVVRGAEGQWLCGFTSRIDASDSFCAEAWGLLRGLELCWMKGFRCIEVEVDAKQLVDMFSNPRPPRALLMPWAAIWDLLQCNWRCNVRHIFREANSCADAMATLGARQHERYKEWTEAPRSLVRLLMEDKLGVELYRSQRALV